MQQITRGYTRLAPFWNFPVRSARWFLPGSGKKRLGQVLPPRPRKWRRRRRRFLWFHPRALSNCPEPPGHNGCETFGRWKCWGLGLILFGVERVPLLRVGRLHQLFWYSYDSYVWTRLFLFPCIIVLSMDYHPFPTNKFLRSRQAGISDFDGAHLRDHLSVSLNASGCTKTTNTVPQNAKIPTFPNHNTTHLGPEMEKTP